MVDRFERFSFAIYEISRYWHKIAGDEMAKYGLKGPYAEYFTTLSRFPEGITATRLGELCGRDKADVSRAICAMEEKGLVTKDASGKRYRALLRLTDAGLAAARQINDRAHLAVECGGKGLTPEKRAIFYEALALITENLQTLSTDGLPQEEAV